MHFTAHDMPRITQEHPPQPLENPLRVAAEGLRHAVRDYRETQAINNDFKNGILPDLKISAPAIDRNLDEMFGQVLADEDHTDTQHR